jgi:O-antigen/teichoic acid export membrane protein
MAKLDRAQIINNVGSSWFALGINILVGIFLSPLILHRLGDTAFGIWVLTFSITGYYGLFDLGIRSSIVRYVSKFTAVRDAESLAKLVNTSFFIYSCIGILSLFITVAGTFYVPSLFHIPADLQSVSRWLFLVVGTSVSLGFPLGISAGILEGLQRFYVNSWTNVATSLLRAVLIVYVLNRGYGLLTVALITAGLPTIASLTRCVIAFRLLSIPIGFRYVDRAAFREIAQYGGTTFIIVISGQLRFRSDEIVIGAFLSTAAITYFNIGARIVDYAVQVVTSLAQIFVPMSSQSEAVGNVDRLRKIFIAGNRICAFIMFPICAVLVILGKSVIELWVGTKYVPLSYPVLLIMLIPSTLFFAQASSGRILFGMGRHRTWALVTLVEGVSNLILSILLVRPYGIVGDALGTAIPLTCSALFFLPAHLCQQLGIRLSQFLRQAYTLPVLLSAPLVTVLLIMRHYSVPHTYWQLAAQLAVGGLVYGLGLVWAFVTENALGVDLLSRPADAAPISPTENFPQDA